MLNFENVGRELQNRGKTDGIKALAESEDGMKIGRMVDVSAVEAAARSGDSEALRNMLSRVLSTDEGKRLAESVKKMMQD